MNPADSVALLLLFVCFVLNPTTTTTTTGADIYINCGSTGTSTASNGREWTGDVAKPKSNPSVLVQGASSATSTAGPIPHRTARISRSRFAYEFQLKPEGQKILRLHFNSAPYKGFKGLNDLFTVEAGPFILLGNFSASLTADALRVNSFSKEFCLFVQETNHFSLSFSPETSGDTYAFVNGIEIISVPDGFSYFHGGGDDTGVQVIGHRYPAHVDHRTALELIHRLNIKHRDFGDGFPLWALREADTVKNETWKIAVDVGFRYMVRLLFSEIGLKIAGSSGDAVTFEVLVNGMLAQTNVEIGKEMGGGSKIPWYYYKDYLVMMGGQRKEGKRDLSISLHLYDDLIHGQGILAGFEIFRLSNPDYSLAIPNPVSPSRGSTSKTSQIFISVLGPRNEFAFFAVTIISLVSIIVHKLRVLWEVNSPKELHKPSARADRLCRRFSLSEIQLATRNFSDALLIGRGGFGKVYRGNIDRGQTTVAVKRLKPNSMQGAHEFLMEIETLSELRHANLVSLIGYCNESREMILVYDYMAGGTLADHLHKLQKENNNFPSLTWKQRLDICIGAGRGLDYLHTGHGVIHRDVKTTNILLNDNFVAKVSDFGLAKHEDRTKLQSHVSTRVKGTKGYMDPHYLHTRKLTRKTDTYAFGVVLFEVLCGRAVVDLSFPEDEHILTIWAREMVNKGKVDMIVASVLRAEISQACLKTFVGVAERCLRDEPKNRPTMSQVVQQLELALEQQDRRQVLVPNEITSAPNGITSSSSYMRPISVGTKQPISASPSVQNPKEQTNFKRKWVNGEIPSGRKATMRHKPSRIRPWDAIWNRFKPLKKNAFSTSAGEGQVNLGFSLRELKVATENFSYKNVLGRGGFGKVYKGRLADGSLVAVKRLKEDRTQGGELQFQAEVEMLSMALHRNLLRLRGYCMTPTERLLVYTYMANGSVASCLRERSESKPPLDWPKRKGIALGSARGLAYLHDHCDPKIIHRDVKSANILLDEDFVAVVGDFGLIKLMSHNDSGVTTAVRGTIGHIAPEYLATGKASEKTDVFGYGIMLLEIITGQRAFDLARLANDDDVMLLDWVKGHLMVRNLETLVDAELAGNYIYEEVEQLFQIALLCTQGLPMKRPKMSEVERMLEGNGLVERWEELQREEMFNQEVFPAHHNSNSDWILESRSNIRPEELSDPR